MLNFLNRGGCESETECNESARRDIGACVVEIQAIKANISNHESRIQSAENRLTDHYQLLVDMRGDIATLKSEQTQIMDIVQQTRKTGQETLDTLNKHYMEDAAAQSRHTNLLEGLSRRLTKIALLIVALIAVFASIDINNAIKALKPVAEIIISLF